MTTFLEWVLIVFAGLVLIGCFAVAGYFFGLALIVLARLVRRIFWRPPPPPV